mmetsp:Transcript_36212/g.40734  ORF Transcript_36212/g.40734 Transcript_36212/m.40734 type:complete len:113 (+) Transcript_36212:293-631(+)
MADVAVLLVAAVGIATVPVQVQVESKVHGNHWHSTSVYHHNTVLSIFTTTKSIFGGIENKGRVPYHDAPMMLIQNTCTGTCTKRVYHVISLYMVHISPTQKHTVLYIQYNDY